MDAVARLGCICCLLEGLVGIEAEIHHVRLGNGMKVRDHMRVLPLCSRHHRHGPPSIAFHVAPRLWKWSEETLLYVVAGLLAHAPRVLGSRRA